MNYVCIFVYICWFSVDDNDLFPAIVLELLHGALHLGVQCQWNKMEQDKFYFRSVKIQQRALDYAETNAIIRHYISRRQQPGSILVKTTGGKPFAQPFVSVSLCKLELANRPPWKTPLKIKQATWWHFCIIEVTWSKSVPNTNMDMVELGLCLVTVHLYEKKKKKKLF